MSTKPYIGQMDRKITVQEFTKSQNASGEEVRSWANVASPWAFMEDVSGSEDVEGKVVHIVSRRYTIRYNSEIAATGNDMRVVDGSDTFNVYYVKHQGRKQHLQLLVTDYE